MILFIFISCRLFSRFNHRWRKFLEQMPGKDNQVFNIDDTVAPGYETDITQLIIRNPIINYNTHIIGSNEFIR